MKHLQVVGAIPVYRGKILCLQRGESRYPYTAWRYEFPGGKIEPGETKVQALERELWEELELRVTIDEKNFFYTVEYQYPDFTLTMDTYLCPLAKPDFVMKEHKAAQWLYPEQLPSLDWAPADTVLIDRLSRLKQL